MIFGEDTERTWLRIYLCNAQTAEMIKIVAFWAFKVLLSYVEASSFANAVKKLESDSI
jgi:hypothetical protein